MSKWTKVSVPDIAFSDGYVVSWNNTDGYFSTHPPTSATAVTMAGDVSGLSSSNIVNKINGITINTTTPTNNQVLTYDTADGYWRPQTPATVTAVTMTGDVTGNSSSNSVIKLQGVSVNSMAPADNQVLTYDAADGYWYASTPTDANLAGDVTGSESNNTVVKIQNKSLNSSLSSLGTNQDGYVLTYINGSSDWEAKPTAQPRTSSWVTALDIDFTTEPTQNISADGYYTIGGFSGWQKQNSSAGSITLDGSNALKFVPGYTGLYDQSHRTTALLWLPLSALGITYLDYDTTFRVWINVGFESRDFNNSGDGIYFGIDSNNTLWTPGYTQSVNNGSGTRLINTGYRKNGLGGASTGFNAGTVASGHTGCLRTDIPHLAKPTFAPVTFRYPGILAWPAVTAPTLQQVNCNPFTIITQTDMQYANFNSLGPAANFGIFLTAQAGGGSSNYLCKVYNLRVDYKY